MEAAEVERAGINLKPSGRTSEPVSLQEPTDAGSRATVGNIAVDDPIFSCRDVDVYYGAKHAIKKVGIDVGRKQVLAMIGPSGCGKSTFLRCLNRMNEHTAGATVSGRVELDGVDIYDRAVDPVRLRRRVGMVFQKPNPFPTMSIRDNVLAGLRLNGIRVADADALVEKSLRQVAMWDEVKDSLNRSA